MSKKFPYKWSDLYSIELSESRWIDGDKVVFMSSWVKDKSGIGGSRKITIFNPATGKYGGNCRFEDITHIEVGIGKTESFLKLLNKKRNHLVKS